MRFVRVALVSAALLAALNACGSSSTTSSAPAGGGGSAPTSAAATPAGQAGGTANISFSGGVTGKLTQPTKVVCSVTPVNIYVSLVGPVGGTNYDLELEAYAFTGSGAGTFTVGGQPQASGQLGPAEQHPNYGSTSGTITLTSKTAGMTSMTFTATAGGAPPVTVSGNWSCASAS